VILTPICTNVAPCHMLSCSRSKPCSYLSVSFCSTSLPFCQSSAGLLYPGCVFPILSVDIPGLDVHCCRRRRRYKLNFTDCVDTYLYILCFCHSPHIYYTNPMTFCNDCDWNVMIISTLVALHRHFAFSGLDNYGTIQFYKCSLTVNQSIFICTL